jgi:hypothetical protein
MNGMMNSMVPYEPFIERVLAERLREVRALVGTRIAISMT